MAYQVASLVGTNPLVQFPDEIPQEITLVQNGWTPQIKTVDRGNDKVLQIYGWIGGFGNKPVTGYIFNGGITPDINSASSINSKGVNSINGKIGTVTVTKTDLSLGSVDNTADLEKPVSTPQQAALQLKANNSLKINGKTLTEDINLSKSDIGLPLVDNTPDSQKPVSGPQQDAINQVTGGVKVLTSLTEDPLPNVDAYKATVEGTYAKMGNVAVSAQDLLDGDVQILRSTLGVWSKKIIPVPGLAAYAKKIDLGPIRGVIQSNVDKPVTFDFVSATFTYPANMYISVASESQSPVTITGETLPLPPVLSYILFRVSTGSFIIKAISDADSKAILLNPDYILCGTVFRSQKIANLNGSYYKIGRYEYGVSYNKRAILQTSKVNPINFNFATNQVILTGNTYVLLPDTGLFPFLTPQAITIPSIACYILYKISTNSLEVMAITDSNITSFLERNQDYAVVGTCFKSQNSVNMFGAYFQIDGKDYGITVSDGNTFTDTVQRLILPPAMYFVDGEELPVYKNNIISERDAKLLNQLTTVVKSKLNRADRYNGFTYNASLKPENLANTFAIAMRTSLSPDFNYYKDINKKTVAANSATGKAKAGLFFGDSLTSGGVPTRIIAALAERGATLRSVGSFPDAGGTYAEGKGGWSFRGIVGKDNNMSNQAITITTPLNSGVSGQFSNPFLKLATESDKADRPTWCFRNTGAQQELSYQEDPVKTGDFYIFDFGWYIVNRGKEVPDFVTIAYGTNDIGLDALSPSIWLAQVRLALEIMIKQIKAAYPNMIIGVVPNPNWSSSIAGDNRNINDGSILIENIMTDIKAYQSTFNNLHIIPVWCHLNKDFNFEYPTLAGYKDNVTDISSVNDSKKISRAEYIHFNATGYEEYIKALEAWVMNVI